MRTILTGLKYSKECGDHPGTIPLVGLVVLGAIAGGFVGVAIALGIFAPMYLYGAYERGKMIGKL